MNKRHPQNDIFVIHLIGVNGVYQQRRPYALFTLLDKPRFGQLAPLRVHSYSEASGIRCPPFVVISPGRAGNITTNGGQRMPERRNLRVS